MVEFGRAEPLDDNLFLPLPPRGLRRRDSDEESSGIAEEDDDKDEDEEDEDTASEEEEEVDGEGRPLRGDGSGAEEVGVVCVGSARGGREEAAELRGGIWMLAPD